MRRAISVYVLLALILGGCSWIQKVGKDIADMTPKEKAVMMMGTYNAQDADYRRSVALPNLTEAEKAILRQKKKILETVYPLILLYDKTQAEGGVTSPEVEAEIFGYLTQLEHLLVRAAG